MFIISSLGSKGGTGKSAIIFAIMLTLISIRKSVLIINCDNSSTTLPTLMKAGGIDNIDILDIDDYYVYSFFLYNKAFLEKFDIVLVDLKGEELRDKDLSLLFDIVDVFIMPIMISMAGMPAAFSLLEKANTLGLPMEKIYLVYNLLGYNEKSETFTKIKSSAFEYSQGTKFNIVDDPILSVTNMDDKGYDKGILSIKKNADTIKILIEKLLKSHASGSMTSSILSE